MARKKYASDDDAEAKGGAMARCQSPQLGFRVAELLEADMSSRGPVQVSAAAAAPAVKKAGLNRRPIR